MKQAYLAIVLIFSSTLLLGQTKSKKIIGIYYFTQSAIWEQDVSGAVSDAVTTVFQNAKRFTIVDRRSFEMVKMEQNTQTDVSFIDGKVVAQGRNLGAEYIVTGNVNLITTEPYKALGLMDGVKANLSISINLTNVTTGEVKASETLKSSGTSTGISVGNSGIGTSNGTAVKDAIKEIEKEVAMFIDRNLPASYSIALIQEKDKKGGASTLLITGGKNNAVKVGDRFNIVYVTTIQVNGVDKPYTNLIGEVVVRKVEDDNFSVCEVKKGGVEISAKFDAKATIEVITKPETK